MSLELKTKENTKENLTLCSFRWPHKKYCRRNSWSCCRFPLVLDYPRCLQSPSIQFQRHQPSDQKPCLLARRTQHLLSQNRSLQAVGQLALQALVEEFLVGSWVGSTAASSAVTGCCPVVDPMVALSDSTLVAYVHRFDEEDTCSVVPDDSDCSDTTFVHPCSHGYHHDPEPELLGNDHHGDFQSMDSWFLWVLNLETDHYHPRRWQCRKTSEVSIQVLLKTWER